MLYFMDGLFHGVSIYFNGFGGSPILRNPHISRDIPYITGGHNPCGMAILTCVDVLCDPVPLGEARRGADHVPSWSWHGTSQGSWHAPILHDCDLVGGCC